MKRLRLLIAAAAVLASPSAGLAQMSMPMATPAPSTSSSTAPLSGKPSAAEAPFVAQVAALAKRYPTTADAERAGYVRYTNEDETGAISYANRKWTSTDAEHPSQLWYDVNGRLLGADYSVLQASSPTAPALWGVDPARWQKIGAHVHWVAREPNGALSYSHGMGTKKFAAAGGDPNAPTPEALVKAGGVQNVNGVVTVFAFPAIWDLTVWILPNPNGAFAEKNPNVVPKHPQKDAG